MEIKRRELKAALARRGLSQHQLARKLGVAPSTFSGWVVGAYEPPADWLTRIEKLLQLEAGTLSSSATGGSR